jgi:aerobic carbon-monoxide dehydrogenase medium subunit
MTRHAEIEHSAQGETDSGLARLRAGIADVQVRNRGTIGGSLAEADPSGDWANALITLDTTFIASGPAARVAIH